MTKQAVIIYGPPGSGKGTQAELLSRKYNFIHFDTGRYIESLVHSAQSKKDSVLKRERKFFDSGILCTPSWVLKIVREATARISKAGYSIIFSGSPRTVYEALGDTKNKGILHNLIKFYGKKNVLILRLAVRDRSSLKRNSRRLVCSICGLPVMALHKNEACSLCGGKFRVRSLDKPEIIKVRLKEYRGRTYPILEKAKKMGIRSVQINGEPMPYKVFSQVEKSLKLRA